MSFFTFNQNNSGGSFNYDRTAGISRYVIVEADTANEAINIAKGIGLYFDGYGDCSCCGDRWSDYIRESDAKPQPSIYDAPLTVQDNGVYLYNEQYGGWMKEFEGFVHFLDGNIVPILSVTRPYYVAAEVANELEA